MPNRVGIGPELPKSLVAHQAAGPSKRRSPIDRAVLIQVFLNPERRCYKPASSATSASDKAWS